MENVLLTSKEIRLMKKNKYSKQFLATLIKMMKDDPIFISFDLAEFDDRKQKNRQSFLKCNIWHGGFFINTNNEKIEK